MTTQPMPSSTTATATTLAAKPQTRPMISEFDIQRRIFLPQVKPELRDRASVWQEYKTPDQKLYYYNVKTQERRWNKPSVLHELDDEIAIIKEQKAKKESKAREEASQHKHSLEGEVLKVGTSNDVRKHDIVEKPAENNHRSPGNSQQTLNAAAIGSSNNDNHSKSSVQQHQQRDGLRPVSSTAIPGTPWCVVWTDKDSVFYFNPSTKTSVWERPAELREREDVDKLVSCKSKSKPQILVDSCDSLESPGKRIKLDADDESRDSQSSTGTSSMKLATNSKPIAAKVAKKDAPSEVEIEAAKKRETIPFEERVQIFCQMLEEKEIDTSLGFLSPRVLSKIVFDPRYLLLISQERKEVFDKYCRDKAEEERRHRRLRLKKATDDFKALCNEANLTPRSTYSEFHTRFSKDPRYKALEKPRDRELLFEDHLAFLRRRERDEQRRERDEQRRERGELNLSDRNKFRKEAERARHQLLSREDAEDTFSAVLIERITDTDISWHDAKMILRKSPQYDSFASLPREWKQATFEKHCERLFRRRREKFLQLLCETKEISLDSAWRDVRRLIREDPRYIRFSTSDKKCEREYKDFLRARISQAKSDFRELLKETELIDSNTRKTIEESEHQHLIAIIGTLQNDKRYKDLEPLSEERRKILLSYIEELAAAKKNLSKFDNPDQLEEPACQVDTATEVPAIGASNDQKATTSAETEILFSRFL